MIGREIWLAVNIKRAPGISCHLCASKHESVHRRTSFFLCVCRAPVPAAFGTPFISHLIVALACKYASTILRVNDSRLSRTASFLWVNTTAIACDFYLAIVNRDHVKPLRSRRIFKRKINCEYAIIFFFFIKNSRRKFSSPFLKRQLFTGKINFLVSRRRWTKEICVQSSFRLRFKNWYSTVSKGRRIGRERMGFSRLTVISQSS